MIFLLSDTINHEINFLSTLFKQSTILEEKKEKEKSIPSKSINTLYMQNYTNINYIKKFYAKHLVLRHYSPNDSFSSNAVLHKSFM